MTYHENVNKGSNNTLFKVMGWFFLFLGVFSAIQQGKNILYWREIKENYNKEYVCNELGTLYYEQNNEKIYVKEIKNLDGGTADFSISDGEAETIYCEKNNIDKCIYLNYASYQYSDNPIIAVFILLLIISLGLFCILPGEKNYTDKNNQKKMKVTLSRGYLFCLTFFLSGLAILVYQGYKIIEYNAVLNQGNVTVGTLYAKIHGSDYDSDSYNYKPLYSYYVGNDKYIYEKDGYVDSTVFFDYPETVDIYYDKDNPRKAFLKGYTIDWFILFGGLFITVITSPLVFLKRRIEKKYSENLSEQKHLKWKI